VWEDDRKAKKEAAKARMNQDGGGVASTEPTHHDLPGDFRGVRCPNLKKENRGWVLEHRLNL
jgi:hypothetical protein